MLNKKRKSKRTLKNKVRNVNSIMFRKMHLSFVEKRDTFVCSMIVRINEKQLSIIGDLDPNFYTDGIRIKTPNGVNLIKTNCNEIFISKKDSPNMHRSIIDYIHETGDLIDSGVYDKSKHGTLYLIDTGIWVSDNNLSNHLRRLSYYD